MLRLPRVSSAGSQSSDITIEFKAPVCESYVCLTPSRATSTGSDGFKATAT